MSKKVPSRTRGTLQFFKRQTWNNMNKRCVNGAYHDASNPKNEPYIRKGVKITMTKSMFYRWCDANEASIMWYYNRGMTPSVDRIDPNKNYHPSNIQIISLRKNIIKSNVKRS